MKSTTFLLFTFFLSSFISNAQIYQWAKNIGSAGFESGNSIVVDGSGNVYTVGSFQETADFDPNAGTSNLTSQGGYDVFISKQDPSGNLIWAKSVGGAVHDFGVSIAIDNSGNVYTTGVYNGTADFDPGPGTNNLTSAGWLDIFILKLSSAGDFLWAKSMGGEMDDIVNSICVDSAGNVYTTGGFTAIADFNPGIGTSTLSGSGFSDIFISKLDENGNFVWAKRIGGTFVDEAKSIHVDVLGNIYIAGFFCETVDFDPGAGTTNLTSVGSPDIFISKFDVAGNFLWAKSMGDEFEDAATSVYVDAFGNVYATGEFQGTADFDPGAGTSNLMSEGSADIFIVKLNPLGNFLWAKSMGSTFTEQGNSIAVDGSGNVYTTGFFSDTVDFDPGPETSNFTSEGEIDFFILKLDASGNFVWANITGTNLDDSGNGIAVDGLGSVYSTGFFSGIADFDTGTGTDILTCSGGPNIFILKLDGELASIMENSFGKNLIAYPNPSNGLISIDLGANYQEVNVIVKNQLGQEVLEKTITGSNSVQLNIPGEVGMYFIEVSNGFNQAVLKVVKE